MSITAVAPTFFCEVEPDRDCAWVKPVGELDLATVDALDREVRSLLTSGFRSLVLDLRALSFLDSTGVRYILTLARAAEPDGFRLELVQGGDHVRRLFELTGTLTALPFLGSR